MIKLIKYLYIHIVPYGIRKKRAYLKKMIGHRKLVKSTLKYYENSDIMDTYDKATREEISNILNEFTKKREFNRFYMIEESTLINYGKRKFDILYDKNKKLRYIIVDGKKMYFKRSMDKYAIVDYFNYISLEQDYTSPHRYLSHGAEVLGVISRSMHFEEKVFEVKQGDVVIDLGAAEGNFALSVIDLASKLYIFECDDEWYEALQATFEPYQSKVEIIKKCVSNINDKYNISLDNFFQNRNEEVNFIKLDIEGTEEAALEGAISIMKNSKNMKIALCTYHRPEDEQLFSNMLSELGFNISFTKGYMVVALGDHPHIRKGVMRASKLCD